MSELESVIRQLEALDHRITPSRVAVIAAVLAAPDIQQITLEARDPASPATAVYQWSDSGGTAALLCNNLASLQQGQVYQVWLITEVDSYSAGSFQAWDGIGQLSMDLDDLPEHPIAIGVSIEDTDGAVKPGEMFLFAEFQQ